MTEGDRLVHAICADPTDDFPRLLFADWCEDTGDLDHALFVRLQVEEEKQRCPDRQLTIAHLLRKTPRMRPLLSNCDLWAAPVSMLRTAQWKAFPHWYRRGFPCEVNCRLYRWLEHGKGVVRLLPIEKVALEDTVPDTTIEPAAYAPTTRHMPARLLDLVSDRLDYQKGDYRRDGRLVFCQAGRAHRALSDACIVLARHAAGLSPLATVPPRG